MTNILNAKTRIGKTRVMNCGMEATIIAYRGCNDIDVRFENGIIRNHVSLNYFNRLVLSPIPNSKANSSYIGEEKIANNGQKMKIIECNKLTNIKVQFEDGTIVNTAYRHFKMGAVRNPNIQKELFPKIVENRIGKKNISSTGQEMTIVAYRNANDIDVQFKDGTIVRNTNYRNFKKGEIENPNFTKKDFQIKKHINKTNIANNGLKMTIVAYRNANDIDVQFEDGLIVKNKGCNKFNKGNIGHPGLRGSAIEPFHGFKVKKCPIYIGNEIYYKAINLTTNEEVIMTPQQMIAWEKEYQKLHSDNKEPDMEEFDDRNDI